MCEKCDHNITILIFFFFPSSSFSFRFFAIHFQYDKSFRKLFDETKYGYLLGRHVLNGFLFRILTVMRHISLRLLHWILTMNFMYGTTLILTSIFFFLLLSSLTHFICEAEKFRLEVFFMLLIFPIDRSVLSLATIFIIF